MLHYGEAFAMRYAAGIGLSFDGSEYGGFLAGTRVKSHGSDVIRTGSNMSPRQQVMDRLRSAIGFIGLEAETGRSGVGF